MSVKVWDRSNLRIEVWKPRIEIPDDVKLAAKDFKFKRRIGKFRDDYAVDPLRLAVGDRRIDAMYADGICDWHNDTHIDNNYSLLFVVRNDTGSYVESQGVEPVLDQPVGTMILLNIWEEHRLWHELGNDCPEGTYLVLSADLNEPLSREECEEKMKSILHARAIPSLSH